MKGAQYPQKTIIAGKIDHYNPEVSFDVSAVRIGFYNYDVDLHIDGKGNFHAVFQSYIPQTVYLRYNVNFALLLFPGDSLFVSIDGNSGKDRPTLLRSVKFGGANTEINQQIGKFQEMLFSSDVYNRHLDQQRATKEYDVEQYVKYNEDLRQKYIEIYNRFVREVKPNEISRQWAQDDVESFYYQNIGFYPQNYKTAKNILPTDTIRVVPDNYFAQLEPKLPIRYLNLMNSNALSSYCAAFQFYIQDKLKKSRKNDDKWMFLGDVLYIPVEVEEKESVPLNARINFVQDTLLREIMLTYYFSQQLLKQEIKEFEKYTGVVEKYIREPFLKEPLYELYKLVKYRTDNPELYSKAVLREVNTSSVKDVFNDIIASNRGKVIYIDFWGTWCGPCLSRFPDSKKMESELENKNVAFVYICLQSNKEQYLAVLSKYQLGGQHYLLTTRQSEEIQTILEISGIPFYVLIDANGVVKEKGNHLGPSSNTMQKILDMCP